MLRGEIEKYYEKNYDTLVKRYRATITGGGADAEDIVQEAFTNALHYATNPLRQIDNFEHWFNVILSNAAKKHLMREARMGMSEYVESMDEAVPMDEWGANMIATIKLEMLSMAPQQQDVVYLYYFREFKPREIADVSELSYAVISNTIKRFKEHIINKFGDVMKE